MKCLVIEPSSAPDISVMGSFHEPDDNRVARITPTSIERAILELGSSDKCDAIFVSCTNMRVARIVEQVETKLGKPVTSGNHALASHSRYKISAECSWCRSPTERSILFKSLSR